MGLQFIEAQPNSEHRKFLLPLTQPWLGVIASPPEGLATVRVSQFICFSGSVML